MKLRLMAAQLILKRCLLQLMTLFDLWEVHDQVSLIRPPLDLLSAAALSIEGSSLPKNLYKRAHTTDLNISCSEYCVPWMCFWFVTSDHFSYFIHFSAVGEEVSLFFSNRCSPASLPLVQLILLINLNKPPKIILKLQKLFALLWALLF